MVRRILAIALVVLTTAGGCQDSRSPQFPRHQAADGRLGLLPGVLDPAEFGPADLPAAPSIDLPNPRSTTVWNASLEELLELAMQNSNVVRVVEGGSLVTASATSYDPAIAAQATEAALAAFDTSFVADMYYNRIHGAPDSFYGPGLPVPTRRDEGTLDMGFRTPWITGGESRILYNPPTGYLYFPGGGEDFFNPTLSSNLEFSLRQPLLRGAGIAVNRAPIRVARLKAEQSIWDLKQAVMGLVRSVEESYWELVAAQSAERTIAAAVPLAEEVARVEQAQFEAQKAARADVARARAELHALRQSRIRAQATVADRELQLRTLIGLPPADGRRIVPSAKPAWAPVVVDLDCSVVAAMDSRPDLVRRRLALRVRELELLVARNSLWPQLDLQGLYRMNGVGEDLNTSLDTMFGAHYTDYQVMGTFSYPIGNRAGKAAVRTAQLQMAKEQALLREAVYEAAYQVSQIVQQLDYVRQEYEEAEQRVRESNAWLEGARARYLSPPPAGEGENWLLQALDDYLQAMRSATDASVEAADLLSRYNGQLVRLEEAKGTLLASRDVYLLGEPSLPRDVRRRRPRFDSCARDDTAPPPASPVAPDATGQPGPAIASLPTDRPAEPPPVAPTAIPPVLQPDRPSSPAGSAVLQAAAPMDNAVALPAPQYAPAQAPVPYLVPQTPPDFRPATVPAPVVVPPLPDYGRPAAPEALGPSPVPRFGQLVAPDVLAPAQRGWGGRPAPDTLTPVRPFPR